MFRRVRNVGRHSDPRLAGRASAGHATVVAPRRERELLAAVEPAARDDDRAPVGDAAAVRALTRTPRSLRARSDRCDGTLG